MASGFLSCTCVINSLKLSGRLTPTNTPSPSPTITPTPYPNLILSEIYPYPLSNEKEWVELYNPNIFQVSVDSWSMDDGENGGSAPQKLSGTIPPLSFLSFDLSVSLFNNDGDVIRLLNPEGKEVAKTSYSSISQSQSWSLQKNGNDYCQTSATKMQSIANVYLTRRQHPPFLNHMLNRPHNLMLLYSERQLRRMRLMDNRMEQYHLKTRSPGQKYMNHIKKINKMKLLM